MFFVCTQDTPEAGIFTSFVFDLKLACCAELTVLFAIPIFSVHPLYTANQSIGICKQKLKEKPSYKLRFIITMSVFALGLFDFILVISDVLANIHGK